MTKCKMKKILLILLLMLPLGYAELCSDTKVVNQNCTMLTPILTCGTYNYTIFNSTGGINETGDLGVYNAVASIYYLNFSKESGDFLIVLCDGSTREISVINGDIMLFGALILGAFIMCIVFIYISANISQEHQALKGFFLLFGIAFFLVPLWLSLLVVTEFYPQFALLADALSIIVQIYSYVLYGILAYVLVHIFIMVYKKRKEKHDREFGYNAEEG